MWRLTLGLIGILLSVSFAQPNFRPLETLSVTHYHGHGAYVVTTALSADGSRFISSDVNGQVILWDVATGKALSGWTSAKPIYTLALNTDGTAVIGATTDSFMAVRDAATGNAKAVWTLSAGAPQEIRMSPDDQRFAAGFRFETSNTFQMQVCRAFAGDCFKVGDLDYPGSIEGKVAFSQDSQTVFVAEKTAITARRAEDGAIRWTQPVVTKLNQFQSISSSLALSPDGQRLLVGTDDGLRVLNSSSGAVMKQFETRNLARALGWNPDGSRFASQDRSDSITVWDATTLEPIVEVDGQEIINFGGEADAPLTTLWSDTLVEWDERSAVELRTLEVKTPQKIFLKTSGVELFAQQGNEMRLRDSRANEWQTLRNQLAPLDVVAHPGGLGFALSAANDVTRFLEVGSGAVIRELEGSVGADQMAFSPDGSRFASPYGIVEVSSGKRLFQISGEAADKGRRNRQVYNRFSDPGLRGLARCVAWSPDGKRIAIGFEARGIGIWDANTGAFQERLLGHTGWVLALAWRPDGKQLVSSSGDGTLRFWSPGRTALPLVRPVGRGFVRSVAYSPDGRTLASTSSEGAVILWDSSSAEPIKRLEGHTAPSTVLAWGKNGKYLISGSSDRSLRVWDVASGQTVQVIDGLDGPVLGLTITPDETRVIAVTRGSSLRFWGHSDGSRMFEGSK